MRTVFRGRKARWLLLILVVMAVCGWQVPPLQGQIDSPHYEKALQALVVDVNDMPTAVSELEIALQGADNPQEKAEIGLLLGTCYRWNGQTDEAIETLMAVIAYRPGFHVSLPEQKIAGLDAEGDLGLCYKEKGNLPEAIHWWEKVLARVPDANAILAELMMARRELAKAGELEAGPMVVTGEYYLGGPVSESNDRLLVSAPELARRLRVGAEPRSKEQLEICSDDHRLLLSAGSREALLDGEPIRLPVAPVMSNGEVLVPLRFVAETFGREVTWEAAPRIAWVR